MSVSQRKATHFVLCIVAAFMFVSFASTVAFSQSCDSITFSPPSPQNITHQGGYFDVYVFGSGSVTPCWWQLVTYDTWIHFYNDYYWNGVSVNYTVDNNIGQERTAYVYIYYNNIGPKVFTIHQEAYSGPTCGNGFCETGETAQNCYVDCHCGNGTCEDSMSETTSNCQSDCYCGNGTCDSAL
jgi:hypothetical protein